MLPSIPYQAHTAKLDNFEFEFRPFNVGMENNLLLLKDSKKPSEIFTAILNLEDECLVGKWKGKAKSLPSYIAELLFIELRKISNGTEIPITLRCNKELTVEGSSDKKVCGTNIDYIIDLNTVELVKPEGYKELFTIEANPPILVKLHQLKAGDYNQDFSKLDTATGLYKHLESITQGDQVFGVDDFSEDEFIQWCSDMPLSTQADISKNFFGKTPYIKLSLDFVCNNPSCQHKQKVEFTSVVDFFI